MPANYYDTFDPANKYKKLLFRAGKGLQSRELNELHDTLQNELKTCIDGLYGNGKLIKGGGINTSGETASLDAGIIWANGYTLEFEAASLAIPQLGEQTLGIAVLETVVTEDEDGTLRDPAIATRNYNEPGAVRLKITGRWSLASGVGEDEGFYPIYTFIDGALQSVSGPAPEIEGALRMLARYDQGSNGNYVIDGFTVSHSRDDAVAFQHVMSVREGLAHVEGYEVTFQNAQTAYVDYGMDVRQVISEPHTFSTGGAYSPFNTPVAAVTRVVGIKEVTSNIIHGSYSGCSDTLPYTPVVSVVSVTQGGTTYVNGTDFTVVGNDLNWSPAGAEPAPGSSYTVVYRYQDEMADEVTISQDLTTINVSGLVEGTVFNIDYTYYLPRIDRIVLTRTEGIVVVKGVPDDANPVPPDINAGLSLATVRVAFGVAPLVTNEAYRAYRMSDVQKIFDRINQLDLTVAQLALKEDMRAQNPTLVAKNLFVDPFLDDDMRDAGATQNALIEGGVLIPQVSWTMHSIHDGADILLPSSPVTAINQNAYTKLRKIDEFTWSEPPPGIITVSPSSYRWISSIRTVTSAAGTLESIDENALIPNISLTVAGSKFNVGETVVISFDGVQAATTTANSNGAISVSFSVPSGIRMGSKLVRAVGSVSGVAAEATFIATAVTRKIIVNPPVPPPRPWWWWSVWNEPLAETFTLSQDSFVVSVGLWFGNLPTTFVDVLICNTQVGFPDRKKVLARSRLYPSQIQLNTLVTFTLDRIVHLTAGEEYAIIVECPDSNATVRVAELGKWDWANYRWLTTQAYDVGVLLRSANSSTWSALQKEDLSFVLNRAAFQSSSQITVGSAQVTGATDLALLAAVDVPQGTSVSFKAVLSDRNNEEIVLSPYVRTPIMDYTGSVQVVATLATTNTSLSPRIFGDVQLSSGVISFPSDYISREFAVDGTHLTLLLDILEPSSTHVDTYYYNGTTWVELTRDVGGGIPIGDGWMQMKYTSELGTTATRIKINLTSTNNMQRPMARNLRVAVA